MHLRKAVDRQRRLVVAGDGEYKFQNIKPSKADFHMVEVIWPAQWIDLDMLDDPMTIKVIESRARDPDVESPRRGHLDRLQCLECNALHIGIFSDYCFPCWTMTLSHKGYR